jgi:ADP-ribosylglycohydrolase
LRGEWSRLVGSSVQAVLATALRALQGSDSFKTGLLQAVSAARQRPTCGALYGSLAGALHGVQYIPAAWLARLPAAAALSNLAQRCAAAVASQS